LAGLATYDQFRAAHRDWVDDFLGQGKRHMTAGGQKALPWVASVLSRGQSESSVPGQRGKWFAKMLTHLYLESREFLIGPISKPKKVILTPKTAISGRLM